VVGFVAQAVLVLAIFKILWSLQPILWMLRSGATAVFARVASVAKKALSEPSGESKI